MAPVPDVERGRADLDVVPDVEQDVVRQESESGELAYESLGTPVGDTSRKFTSASQSVMVQQTSLGSTSHRHSEDGFDYFLSHKKTHSKLGALPEQVAKNIHDVLEIHGHHGFFDVDDLEEISKENLEACIRQCSTMVVYMNDETMKSDWCLFEWQVAFDMGIPIKVVADVAHSLKDDLVEMIKKSKYSFLLKYQWVEYNDSTRRNVIQQISRWIDQEGGAHRDGDANIKEFLYTAKGALCVRDGDEEIQLFHWFFEYYMVACGLVYNKDAWSFPVLLWTRVVRAMSLACFGVCLWRLIYAEGPAYTDWFSCLYVVLIHVFLYHGLIYMTYLLSSPVMKSFLQHMANADLIIHTTRHMNFISKWAAVLGFAAGAACAAGMIIIYLPLFLSSFYLATPMGKVFAISSAIFCVSVAPIVLVQEFAVLTLLLVVTQLLLDSYESSLCSLHELLPSVGLRKFVKSGRTTVTPTDIQLTRFSNQWSNAIALQRGLQRYLNPVICLHYVLNLMGISIPVIYVTVYGDEFLQLGEEPWSKWAKPILWWGFSVLCYATTVFVPAFTSFMLEDIQEEARCLAFAPKAKEYLLMNLQTNLNWRIGPIRLSSFGGLILAAPVLVSLVCWVMAFAMVFG